MSPDASQLKLDAALLLEPNAVCNVATYGKAFLRHHSHGSQLSWHGDVVAGKNTGRPQTCPQNMISSPRLAGGNFLPHREGSVRTKTKQDGSISVSSRLNFKPSSLIPSTTTGVGWVLHNRPQKPRSKIMFSKLIRNNLTTTLDPSLGTDMGGLK